MKIEALRSQSYVKQLRCDRCGRLAEEGESEYYEYTSIDYKAGYGSILGDGNQVAIDLCQHCLKKALGPWLRIAEPSEFQGTFQKKLERFDPEKHGGEFPKNCEMEKLAIQAQDAVGRSSAAIDDALSFVNASTARISEKEKFSRAASELSAYMHRRIRDFQEIAKTAVGREFGSADYDHWDQYGDSQRAIVQRWSSELSTLLGRPVDADGLLPTDFLDTGIKILFEDGSRVRLMRALHVRRGLLVAVFTPRGHHEFELSDTDTVSVFESSAASRWRADNGVFS